MDNNNALIIIAKYPSKGSVKTRLKGHMPDNQILSLYTHLLESTIAELRSIPGVDTFIAYAPDHAKEYFSNFKLSLIPLSDGDIGARMYSAFQFVFSKGYQNAALVGADIPDLSPNHILSAFDVLSSHDLVYGPAKDGGYYLVGMKEAIKDLFVNIPWSSDQTLKKSLEKAGRSGYSFELTETLSDIDTIDDVKRAGLLSL